MKRIQGPSEELVVYLYGFLKSGQLDGVAVPAIDANAGSEVFLHSWSELTAIVSLVRSALFTGAGAEARLHDPAWVATQGCRHASVLEHVGQHTSVFPVPFATLFSSLENLENEMRMHGERIAHTLAIVAERDEWAVKGILDRAGAQRALLAEKQAGRADMPHSPGMRHLHEQRLRRDVEREVNRWLRQKCQTLAGELSSLTDAYRERRLQPQEENGGEMIFNWAYLVARDKAGAFCAKVRKAKRVLERCGLTLECTGAWPPYSFCDIADDGKAAGDGAPTTGTLGDTRAVAK